MTLNVAGNVKEIRPFVGADDDAPIFVFNTVQNSAYLAHNRHNIGMPIWDSVSQNRVVGSRIIMGSFLSLQELGPLDMGANLIIHFSYLLVGEPDTSLPWNHEVTFDLRQFEIK
jgi:hypothetical protein